MQPGVQATDVTAWSPSVVMLAAEASGAQAAGANDGELDALLTRGAETQAAAVWSTGMGTEDATRLASTTAGMREGSPPRVRSAWSAPRSRIPAGAERGRVGMSARLARGSSTMRFRFVASWSESVAVPMGEDVAAVTVAVPVTAVPAPE